MSHLEITLLKAELKSLAECPRIQAEIERLAQQEKLSLWAVSRKTYAMIHKARAQIDDRTTDWAEVVHSIRVTIAATFAPNFGCERDKQVLAYSEVLCELLSHLAFAYWSLYERPLDPFARTGDPAHLASAIRLMKISMTILPDDPKMEALTASIHSSIFHRTGDPKDISRALLHQHNAFKLMNPEDSDWRQKLEAYEWMARMCLARCPTALDATQAISVQKAVIRAATPASSPSEVGELAGSYDTMAKLYQLRFTSAGDLRDLEEAMQWIKQAMVACPNGYKGDPHHGSHPLSRPDMLGTLASCFVAQYRMTESPGAIASAIGFFGELWELLVEGHPWMGLCDAGVLSSLLTAADHDSARHVLRPLVRWSLVEATDRYFKTSKCRCGSNSGLAEAISLGHRAVQLLSAEQAENPDVDLMIATFDTLGSAHYTSFKRNGTQADLDEAITLGTRAITTIQRAKRLSSSLALSKICRNVSDAFAARFDQTGLMADCDHVIFLRKVAVRYLPEDEDPEDYERGIALAHLASAYSTRYKVTRRTEDINQACKLVRKAHRLGETYVESTLGAVLLSSFNHTGNLEDLQDAVSAYREAVEWSATDDPMIPGLLFDLAEALLLQFIVEDEPAHLISSLRFYKALFSKFANGGDKGS